MLSDKDRRILAELQRDSRLTTQELADMTGRPRNTVLSQLHRARHKLRDAIGDDARKEAQS